MGFFDWLFGKQPQPQTEVKPPSVPTPPATSPPPVSPPVRVLEARVTATNGSAAVTRTPEENLKRWCESGQARAWVAARNGEWNHDDWLALLDSLQKSEFWPMDAEAIGRTLEEFKHAGAVTANGTAG
jgi:hypothetical protein